VAKQAKRQLAGSGEALPSGSIGESKFQASTSSFTTATTELVFGNITGASLVLDPGVWSISGFFYASAPTFTGGAGILYFAEIYDSTASASIQQNWFSAVPLGVNAADARSGFIQKTVNVTSTKTIILRGAFQKVGGGETVTAGVAFPSGRSYIKADRIA
jgi:hypothetical protein